MAGSKAHFRCDHQIIIGRLEQARENEPGSRRNPLQSTGSNSFSQSAFQFLGSNHCILKKV